MGQYAAISVAIGLAAMAQSGSAHAQSVDEIHQLEAGLEWSTDAGPLVGAVGVASTISYGQPSADSELEAFVAIGARPQLLSFDASASLRTAVGVAGETGAAVTHSELVVERAIPLGDVIAIAFGATLDIDLAPRQRLVDAELSGDLVLALDRRTELLVGARGAWSWLDERAIVGGVLTITRRL